jgi:hypothetical protein
VVVCVVVILFESGGAMGCLSNLKGTSSKPKGKVVRVTAAGRARKITMLEIVSIELPVCSYPTYFLMCGCKCVFLFLFFSYVLCLILIVLINI